MMFPNLPSLKWLPPYNADLSRLYDISSNRMQLVSKLTKTLQTLQQRGTNAGVLGPYWVKECDYESL